MIWKGLEGEKGMSEEGREVVPIGPSGPGPHAR